MNVNTFSWKNVDFMGEAYKILYGDFVFLINIYPEYLENDL